MYRDLGDHWLSTKFFSIMVCRGTDQPFEAYARPIGVWFHAPDDPVPSGAIRYDFRHAILHLEIVEPAVDRAYARMMVPSRHRRVYRSFLVRGPVAQR